MPSEEYPFKAVCDTSVYIPFINAGTGHPVLSDKTLKPVLYMSAVVLSELYAGAHDAGSIKLIDRLFTTFRDVGRLITPDHEDWRQTGMVIARLGGKYGFESKYLSKIQNDILIACAARKLGAYLVTNNLKDFRRIREFVSFRIYE